MASRKRRMLLPILITLFGVMWVLQEAGLFRSLSLVIAGGLAGTGVFALILSRRGRGALMVGVLLLLAAGLVLLRQSGMLDPRFEAPLMVSIMGGFLLLAHYIEGRSL